MKRATKNVRRVLTLQRETVAQLGVRELAQVVGGDGDSGYPPLCQSDKPPGRARE